jgi:hypothetical protein
MPGHGSLEVTRSSLLMPYEIRPCRAPISSWRPALLESIRGRCRGSTTKRSMLRFSPVQASSQISSRLSDTAIRRASSRVCLVYLSRRPHGRFDFRHLFHPARCASPYAVRIKSSSAPDARCRATAPVTSGVDTDGQGVPRCLERSHVIERGSLIWRWIRIFALRCGAWLQR